jgi:RNA polymerase primary sigma factor
VDDASQFLLNSAGRLPLLTPQQEVELGRRIRRWQDWEGGPQMAPPAVIRSGRRALDRFVSSNLRLAWTIARRFEGRGVPLEDLAQASAEGLLRAYTRFRPELGFRSSSYATWYAMSACQNLIAEQSSNMRLPTQVSETWRRLYGIRQRMIEETGRIPSAQELEAAAELKAGTYEKLRLINSASLPVSLDAPSSVGGYNSPNKCLLADMVPSSADPTLELERERARAAIEDAIETGPGLSPQQRLLLSCRFLRDDPPSPFRQATLLHMKRLSIRQLEERAIKTLRKLLRERGLDCQLFN